MKFFSALFDLDSGGLRGASGSLMEVPEGLESVSGEVKVSGAFPRVPEGTTWSQELFRRSSERFRESQG